jgi:hypothetical protein
MTTRVLPKGYRPPGERGGFHSEQLFMSIVELRHYAAQFDGLVTEIRLTLRTLRELQAKTAAIAACNQCSDPLARVSLAGVDIMLGGLDGPLDASIEALAEALEDVADGELPKQLDFLDLMSEAPMQ